jgi:gamma-glutamylaminecyclotransferase
MSGSNTYALRYNLKGNTSRYYRVECPYCYASKGKPCLKFSGRWAYPHLTRIWLVQDTPEYTIFVYGTLKRGYGNYSRLLSQATFLGEAVSADTNYQMTSGGFPFLAKAGTGHAVKGELFRVNAQEFAACDGLEGHPNFYHRELHNFLLPNGQEVEAWVYLCDYGLNSAASVRGTRAVQPNNGTLEWHGGR